MKTNENIQAPAQPERLLAKRRFKYHECQDKIASMLEADCRATLTQMAKQIGAPVSTVFDAKEKLLKNKKLVLAMEPTGQTVYGSDKQEEKLKSIISCLKENPRMELTEMSKLTNLPVSSIFDLLCKLKQAYRLKAKLEPKVEA